MVAICMRRQALPEKVMPEWEEMCAVASAVQNLWLAATAHGVAGVCSCSCVLHLLCWHRLWGEQLCAEVSAVRHLRPATAGHLCP